MPKSTVFCNDVLALVFNATAIANIAQNNGTSPATSMVVALHTASPGVGGDQSTSEISYTGYARVSVARTTGGFPAPSGGVISPAANIDFGAMTAGAGGTVTHASIGHTPTTTANKQLMFGTVTPNISVTNGVTPRLTNTSTITET
jgi:hypothetical protein